MPKGIDVFIYLFAVAPHTQTISWLIVRMSNTDDLQDTIMQFNQA